MNHLDSTKSSQLFARAERRIPGGVNSPVRAFRAVGREPLFIREAQGASVTDEDGNRFIDYVGSWGPMLMGHAHPTIIEAVRDAATRGTSFGAPTAIEIELAEAIARVMPSIEKVRLVSSGTEATMTAIRVAHGGAQQLYGIKPDLTCLGKIIGGGLPVGAFGGRRDVMDVVAPLGPVYQAGTLSGNPLAVSAGLAMLRLIRETDPYAELERRSAALELGLREAAGEAGVAATVNRVGSMMTAFFSDVPVTSWETAKQADTTRYGRFFRAMLEAGVYLAPSQFECAFVSFAHSDADIERTVEAARRVMPSLRD